MKTCLLKSCIRCGRTFQTADVVSRCVGCREDLVKAASLDLLDALKDLVSSLDWEEKRSGITYSGIEKSRAAIAKAEGR